MSGAHELVLVRHGETEWSRSGRHTGRTDVALTARGRAQADQLASVLRDQPFALVLASPLARAWETYERAGLTQRAEPCPDLQEWDYGDHEGRSTASVREQIPAWSVWTHPITGGESLDQVGARADRVIERADGSDGDVALFGHGHQLRILAARWVGLPPADGRLFGLDTATVSTLGYERTTRIIRHWNEDSHLRGPGEP